ncbi:DUF3368 domain-containing protein [Candidatus Woesearchaeota archaeon]|nr:DUF3368 domain-containing protein [Candidatus Woesearchaeota archaeon]
MIADSSILIVFARINRVGLLNRLYGTIQVPRSVYKEIVEEGEKSGHRDVLILKKAFGDGRIKVIDMDRDCKRLSEKLLVANPNIGDAEADVIALAAGSEKAALIDEHPARMAAKLQGVKCVGSLGLLLKAFSKGIINENETKTILHAILKENFRISPVIVAEFYAEMDRMKSS